MGRLTPLNKAARAVDQAVWKLVEASRLLREHGHEQAARSVESAAYEVAQAIAQAEADAGRAALQEDKS